MMSCYEVTVYDVNSSLVFICIVPDLVVLICATSKYLINWYQLPDKSIGDVIDILMILKCFSLALQHLKLIYGLHSN